MAAPKFNKLFSFSLKLLVTLACIWYVVEKINWQQAWLTSKQSNLFWLFISLLLIAASKIIASYRLNIYFRNINVQLSEKINMQLYWLGMFYSAFLPGGVGGDAYKVIILNKKYQHPVKLLTAAVLLDRVSGVAGIGILSAIYYYAVFGGSNYSIWLLAALIPAMIIYYLIVKKFFPSFVSGFWPAFWLGLAVQVLQVICIYSLMAALHLSFHYTEYVLIFLLSSLIAVLPVFFGPLGAREVIFIWGSKQFLLSRDQSVCISLLFDILSIAIAMIGVYWVYHDPLKKKIPDIV